jgi:hypothetical protein
MPAIRYAVALALGCVLLGGALTPEDLRHDGASDRCVIKDRDPWAWLQRPDGCDLPQDVVARAERDFAAGQSIVRLACVSDRPTLLLQINFAARAVRLKIANDSHREAPHRAEWSYVEDGTTSGDAAGIVEATDGLLTIGLQDAARSENREVWTLDRNTGVLTTNVGDPRATLARCWHMCLRERQPTSAA